MRTILLPIKPCYVKEILAGNKKYEYRKNRPKKNNITKIIIYATAPVQKIVGEVQVLEILKDTPGNIWNKTKEFSGTTENSYNKYFFKHKYAIAYKLGNVKIYNPYKDLQDLHINYIPQSFIYID